MFFKPTEQLLSNSIALVASIFFTGQSQLPITNPIYLTLHALQETNNFNTSFNRERREHSSFPTHIQLFPFSTLMVYASWGSYQTNHSRSAFLRLSSIRKIILLTTINSTSFHLIFEVKGGQCTGSVYSHLKSLV